MKPAIISLLLCLSLSAPLLTVILILFGAPLTTHFWHNLLCATHISLLGVLPLFYVHGVNARMWREISGACLPFDEVWGGLIGAIVGAWLGAVRWRLLTWPGSMKTNRHTGTHTTGLGSRVAKVAGDNCHRGVYWVVCIQICR